MGVLGTRRALGNAQVVRIELAAFLWNDEIDIVVLRHDLGNVAIIFEHQIDLARQQQILAVILVEGLDVGLLLYQHRLDLLDEIGCQRIDGHALIFCGKPEDVASFRQQGNPALIFVTVEQVAPAIGHGLHL